MQLCRQPVHGFGLSGIGGLGNLDAHELGRQAILGGQRSHVLGDIAGKNVHARHVEGDGNYGKPLVQALSQPRGNALPNVLIERHHKAAFLERRDKGAGRDEGAVLVNPACERLGANDLAGFHIDLGLQVVGNAIVGEGVLKLGQRMVECDLVLVFLGAKDGDAVLKVVFGAPVGEHGLCLRVDSDFLVGVDGVDAHGRPKAHAVIVLGHGFAHAGINSMHCIVLKGREDAKVILAPIARNA